MNMLKGTLHRRGSHLSIDLPGGVSVPLQAREVDLPNGAPVKLGIRPEHAEAGAGFLGLQVGATEILGAETIVHGTIQGGQSFTLALRGISPVQPGDMIDIALPEPFLHFFDGDGRVVGASSDWRKDYLAPPRRSAVLDVA